MSANCIPVPLGLGSGNTDGKMRHREVLHLWVWASLGLTGTGVGRRPQRLDFFCSEMELSHLVMDETSGTWGQSFVFAPISLNTIIHILLHVSPRNAFLMTLWKNPISISNKRASLVESVHLTLGLPLFLLPFIFSKHYCLFQRTLLSLDVPRTCGAELTALGSYRSKGPQKALAETWMLVSKPSPI